MLLIALIIAPILAAIVSFIFRLSRYITRFNLCFALLQFLLAAILLILWSSSSKQPINLHLSEWAVPLGIGLYADGISIVLVSLTNIVVFFVSLFSLYYFTQQNRVEQFWPLWWLLTSALNAIFFAVDVFNVYVILEIISLSAVSLVALQGNGDALRAALRYLFVGLAGSMSYLLGVTLLYRSYGVLDLHQLSLQMEPALINSVALGLMSVGLLLKTALFPFHFWLPAAHSSASSPVSAVLSALVVKASFYLLVRFWLDSFHAVATDSGFVILGILGGCAIVSGSYHALKAKRLKLIIAYSTVAQIGYLFLLFPIANSYSFSKNEVLPIVVFFIVTHAFAKAAIFLATGNIIKALGSDELSKLTGLATALPLTIAAFTIAVISLIGLPPSGGFIAKWMMLESSIVSGYWGITVLIVVGGLLAALYFIKVVSLFFKTPSKMIIDTRLTSPIELSFMSWCTFCFALLTIALGFMSPWILQQMGNL